MLVLLVPWVLSKRISAADFGLDQANPKLLVAVSLGGFILFHILTVLFEGMIPGAKKAGDESIRQLDFDLNALTDFGMILTFCVLAPLAEEMLFRGLLYRSLRDGLTRWIPPLVSMLVALAISSWIFMTLHGGKEQQIQHVMLFIFAVILIISYEITGSILAPALIHTLNNTYAIVNGITKANIPLAAGWLYPILYLAPVIVFLILALLRNLLSSRKMPAQS